MKLACCRHDGHVVEAGSDFTESRRRAVRQGATLLSTRWRSPRYPAGHEPLGSPSSCHRIGWGLFVDGALFGGLWWPDWRG